MIANPLQTNLAQADMQHRLAKLISLGTVNEVDYEKALVRVTIGDWLTSWLPWLTAQAFNNLTWQAPEVGEQVVVLAPCGDLAQGVVLGSLYQQNHNLEKVASDVAKESRQHVQRTVYQDGSMVEYDREKHRYYIDIKGESSTRNYSIYVKYLKAKKPDYSKNFWEYLEKQNLLKRGSYHDIKYSIINIKKTGDILYSDLTNERKFYK